MNMVGFIAKNVPAQGDKSPVKFAGNGKGMVINMKKVRTKCKRILCWIQIAAMVFTSSTFSGIEVNAAEAVALTQEETESVENTGEISEDTTDDVITEEAEKESVKDTEQNSEETTDCVMTEESEKESVEENTKKDSEDLDSEEEDTSENSTDAPIISDEEAEPNKEIDEEDAKTVEKSTEEPVAQNGNTSEYGTVQNGDFEAVDGDYGTVSPWTVSMPNGTYKVETNEWAQDKENQFLNLYAESDTSVSVTQTVTNMEAGTYAVSVDTAGESQTIALTICVKADGETLVSKDLEALKGWDKISYSE